MSRPENVHKKVFVLRAQCTHLSTPTKKQDMLLILDLSALTSVTNVSTTQPFARLDP